MSDICHKLHMLFNRLSIHRFPFDTNKIPSNGIYILFESGEIAHGANRVVRVGTHTGANQLRSRVKQHFVQPNKDRSIFRKNIGRAMLNRDQDPFLVQWERDLTTKAARQNFASGIDAAKQKQIEQQVSEYMQRHFFFGAFQVDDKDQRMALESKIISTISLCSACRSSDSWLGRCSPKEKIRESGLWLVNELYKQPFSVNEHAMFQDLLIRNQQVL